MVSHCWPQFQGPPGLCLRLTASWPRPGLVLCPPHNRKSSRPGLGRKADAQAAEENGKHGNCSIQSWMWIVLSFWRRVINICPDPQGVSQGSPTRRGTVVIGSLPAHGRWQTDHTNAGCRYRGTGVYRDPLHCLLTLSINIKLPLKSRVYSFKKIHLESLMYGVIAYDTIKNKLLKETLSQTDTFATPSVKLVRVL